MDTLFPGLNTLFEGVFYFMFVCFLYSSSGSPSVVRRQKCSQCSPGNRTGNSCNSRPLWQLLYMCSLADKVRVKRVKISWRIRGNLRSDFSMHAGFYLGQLRGRSPPLPKKAQISPKIFLSLQYKSNYIGRIIQTRQCQFRWSRYYLSKDTTRNMITTEK